MILLQLEVAQKLLNSQDTTLPGFLLAVIVILIFAIGVLWKSKIADEKYIRAQDRANIELYMALTNTVDDVYKTSNTNGDKLTGVDFKIQEILNIIKERLRK